MPEGPLISVVVPVHNEAANLGPFHQALSDVTGPLPYRFEVIFVDDGSRDESLEELHRLARSHTHVRVVELTRNFGKEIAMTAGLREANGVAAILIDADLQHPPARIPDFLDRWKGGAEVVVGIRAAQPDGRWARRQVGKYFYKALNAVSATTITPNSTDFRLLDRVVIDEFNRLTERNRMTRGLIDWLGFRSDEVHFEAGRRQTDQQASYTLKKLVGLAVHSVVSMSLFPLKAVGYLGMLITLVAGPLGLFLLVEQHLFDDPWGLHVGGNSSLAILLTFFAGVVLTALGMVALYIAAIHAEVVNRPLYVSRPPARQSGA